MPEELTLAELAESSGLQSRTIRSWVAQGLLPGPLSRGPAARYPEDQLQRIQAIRTMKELHGMSLADIRQELLIASADRIASLAEKSASIGPDYGTGSPTASSSPMSAADPGDAVDFFRALRAAPFAHRVGEPGANIRGGAMARLRSPAAPALADAQATDTPATEPKKRPATGFEALELRLTTGSSRASTDRRSRVEDRLTIEITPDIELSVRGKLDADQRARLERCADLMRDILTGRE